MLRSGVRLALESHPARHCPASACPSRALTRALPAAASAPALPIPPPPPRRLMHSTTRTRHPQTAHHEPATAAPHPTRTRTHTAQPAAATAPSIPPSSVCWLCGHALNHTAATSSHSASHHVASVTAATPTAAAAAAAASDSQSGSTAASSATSATAAAPHASSSTAATPAASSSSSPLFCPHCHTLQPEAAQRKDTNLFQIFKLPLSYSLSLPHLDSSFKSLQKSLHPDRFHGEKHSGQHATASHLSSLVNSAYTTLKSPYLRALYLLHLHGVELGESSETVTDPELLMEIMETREWVEELSSPSELHAASRSNRAKLALAQQSVDAAFRAGDFAAMKSATIRLSFLTNIEEEIYKRMPVA